MPDSTKKYYRVEMDPSNFPSQLFLAGTNERDAKQGAWLAIEDWFIAEAIEITAEEFQAADEDYRIEDK